MPVAEKLCVDTVLTYRPPELKITKYDVTVSALAVAASFAVVTLLVIMFAGSIAPPPDTDPVRDPVQGTGAGDAGEFVQIETPAVESPADGVIDPSIANEEREVTELTEVIDQVTNESAIVATVASATLSDGLTKTAVGNQVEGTGTNPIGQGDCDERGGSKRERRWIVEFSEPGDFESYAAQLDSLGIELAAMFPLQGRLVYLSKVSTDSPTKREISERDADGERRMFMSWAEGSEDRKQADKELFQKINIDAKDSEVLHFYSIETEQRMVDLERDFGGRSEHEIRRTLFRVRKSANGYEFYVAKQLLQ